MLHAILRAQGIVAALYTSPHLIDFTERFRVGDADVSWDDLAAAFWEVHLATRGGADPPLTFFEWCTAMAFVLFARRGVKVAVVEAGMGGRWDATRSAAGQLVLVTRIGLDHTEQLGTDPGADRHREGEHHGSRGDRPDGPSTAGVENVIAASFAGGGAPPARRFDLQRGPARHRLSGVCFDPCLRGRAPVPAPIPLPGLHQAGNAALAAAGAPGSSRSGEPPSARRRSGPAWPPFGGPEGWRPGRRTGSAAGRGPQPRQRRGPGRLPGRGLPRRAPGARPGDSGRQGRPGHPGRPGPPAGALYAAPCPNPRTLPAEVLAAEARKAGLPVAGVHRSVTAALDAARLHAGGAAPVVVTGSLYAVAEARARLLGRTIPHPFAQ